MPALAMRRPVVLAASVEASAISASVVKALRDKTGAGMMDCKKALGACGGDAEKVRFGERRGLQCDAVWGGEVSGVRGVTHGGLRERGEFLHR